jgi:hypothetical protein
MANNEFIARKGIIVLDDAQITGSLSVTDNISSNTLTVTSGITGTATSASYVEYSNVAGKPALVSGSSQISFNGITDKPTLVSGSEQVSFNGIVDKPTLVSGSSQVTYSGLTGIPVGIVSSSAQIAGYNLFATTGSNQFDGSQAITGSLTVTGQVVAQTLNVQQVTSSIVFSSGSNIFGNSLSNTQQFTGSLQVSGSSHYVLGNVGIGTTAPQSNLQVLGTIKVATGNAQGILGLGEANGTTVNVGLWRGAANAPTTDGNFLNLGGYDGIVFAVGAAAIGSQTERMRITSGGNVGIGTASPSQKLDVVGKFRVTDDIILAQTNGRIDYDNGVTGALRFYSTSTATERMRITSAGNVGIGTDSPLSNLHVRAASGSASVRIQDSTNNTTLFLQSQNGLGVVGTITNHALRFDTNDTERMRITSGGNVGIGTTDPSGYRLKVQNTGTTGISIQTVGSDSGNPHIQMLNGAIDTTIAASSNGLELTAYSSHAVILRTANTERMRITSGGNVGIGTTPSYRLDVRQVTTDPVAFFGFSQTSSSSNGLIKLNSGRIPQGGSDFTGESGVIFGHSGGTMGVNFDGQGGYIKSIRVNTYAASGESDSDLVFATALDNVDY